jgi:hypothetical protein
MRYQEFDQENRLHVSDDFFQQASQTGYLIKDAEAQGYYRISLEEEAPVLSVFLKKDLSFEDAFRMLAVFSEASIRQYHPKKILVDTDSVYYKLWNANGYYQKGKRFQKVIEPWRLQLWDDAFDAEGYLINQGMMESIPFGWFNTMTKGCGWIAAYNLFKMCGKEQRMQETAEELGRRVLLGAVAGQELYTTYIYLKGKQVNCRLSLSLDSSALACMKKSRYGILLYSHKQGAHYTAYRSLGDGRFLFYNAVYGRVDHIETAEDFLKERELLPFSSVIYVV